MLTGGQILLLLTQDILYQVTSPIHKKLDEILTHLKNDGNAAGLTKRTVIVQRPSFKVL